MNRTFACFVAALGLVVAGCGKSSATSTVTSTAAARAAEPPTTSAPRANGVVITERDFAIDAPVATARAGNVTFAVANQGPTQHEFLIFKTDAAPDQLPLKDGRVNEDNPSINKVFDSGDAIAPNNSRSFQVNLPPGHYVLVCNLAPNHYLAGMHTEFTVAG